MTITRNFIEFRKTWLSIGDKEDDVFSGDGKVIGGPSDGEWHTKDEMRGGGGDDYFDGEFGNNIMFGERGADTFEIGNSGPGASWDRAYGGAGRDRFLAFEYSPMKSKPHLANGGGNFDTMEFQYYVTTGEDGPVDVRNEKVFLNDTVTIKLNSIERLVASVDDDSLKASGAIIELDGGRGDDTLVANPDKNTALIGGFGSDILKGRGKDDFLYDQEEIKAKRPEYIDPGKDILSGGKGDDYLLSYSGNDKLLGGDGSDRIVSLGGTDILKGGNGSDSFEFSYLGISGDTIETFASRAIGTLDGIHIDGGADGFRGDHAYFSGLGIGYGASREKGLVIDLALGRGREFSTPDDPGRFRLKDIEHVTGSVLDDRLFGSSEANRMTGAAGDDVLRGAYGNDVLDGGEGSDRLFGGGGNDELWGGDGDTLTGGAGRDTFAFYALRSGATTITDFEIGTDTIGGNWPAFDKLSLTKSDAGAVITADGSDVVVTLTGVRAEDLSASDFIFS